MKAKGLRRRWLSLHTQLGLWVGVAFVLLGLTGSALTFYQEIDALLNPVISPASTQVSDLSVQTVYEVLRREYPDRTGSWRIELPMSAGMAVAARYMQPAETMHKKFAPLMVTMDPLTYQVTSSRSWGSYPMTWIYDLHYTLLFDEVGHNIVGVIGLLMLVSILLGLWLWKPKWGRITRNMKPIIRSQRVKKVYDLHRIAGLYGGILLAIIALTGVVLVFPQASKGMASALFEFERPMPGSRQQLTAGQPQAHLDRLIERSRRVFPQSEVRWVETSGEDGREVTLRLFNGNEPSRRFPQTYLKLHPVTAEVLHHRDYHELPTGDRLWAWVHPLHNGEAFGMLGRVVTALLGLVPIVLMVTGIIRYLQKRQAKVFAIKRRRDGFS